MNPRLRLALQILGGCLILTLAFLLWRGQKPPVDKAAVLGEEVYASHDCSDCHLAVHILRAKREKKELGLIRVRTDFDVLVKFLETDKRHQSFLLVSAEDRKNLVEYLRTLLPP